MTEEQFETFRQFTFTYLRAMAIEGKEHLDHLTSEYEKLQELIPDHVAQSPAFFVVQQHFLRSEKDGRHPKLLRLASGKMNKLMEQFAVTRYDNISDMLTLVDMFKDATLAQRRLQISAASQLAQVHAQLTALKLK